MILSKVRHQSNRQATTVVVLENHCTRRRCGLHRCRRAAPAAIAKWTSRVQTLKVRKHRSTLAARLVLCGCHVAQLFALCQDECTNSLLTQVLACAAHLCQPTSTRHITVHHNSRLQLLWQREQHVGARASERRGTRLRVRRTWGGRKLEYSSTQATHKLNRNKQLLKFN